MDRIKSFLKYSLLVLIFLGLGFYFSKSFVREFSVRDDSPVSTILTVKEKTEENTASGDPKEQEKKNVDVAATVPKKILIKVPFTSQAPFAQWDEIHEEACEEASLIMMKYYLDNKSLTPGIAEQEIQDMVAFEIKKHGDFKDTNAQQNVDLFNDFYGLPANGKKLKVVYDFSKDDIKKYLAGGSPVIIHAAGRELGNPNFSGLGPPYHVLIAVGYDGNTIITNDPGTRKGEGYKYNIDVLYNAIHDFPGNLENIKQGRKAIVVVE